MNTFRLAGKSFTSLSLLATLCFFISCNTEEATSSDDEAIEEQVTGNPDQLVVDVQNDFKTMLDGLFQTDMKYTRQSYMFDSYELTYNTSSHELSWNKAYQILDNTLLLDALNDQDEYTIPSHLGMAEVIQSYAFMLLVDHFGEVPFSQALDPETYPSPTTDDGVDIYTAHIAILNRAIILLNEPTDEVPEDVFYASGFDKDKWIALANTLKLRAYNNMRLTSPTEAANGIASLLDENLIDSLEEDFQFAYDDQNNQHPHYIRNYGLSFPNTYMSNGLFDLLNAGDTNPPYIEDGIADPRLRYYVYRQADTFPDETLLPCEYFNNGYLYCHVGNSYFGRDHSGNNGIPPDSFIRSLPSIYPVGGAFDKDLFLSFDAAEQELYGAGIYPIYLSSFTFFTLAESALTLGVGNNDPSVYLEQGIRASMEKVSNFGNGLDLAGFEMTSIEVDDYVNRVLTEYNTSAQEDRLYIIEREFYLASWGNGLESYNTYRRTGYPQVQSPVEIAGDFPRVYNYPESIVAANPNILQQPVTNQTFWDNNPPGFID